MQGDDPNLDTPMSSESADALLAHSSFVRSLASRLVFDRDEADDVAQDAWVSYLRKRPDGSRPLAGWFRRVVQNHALQRRRGAGRRGAREQAVARPEGLPSTAEIVERENARRCVIDALVALREPYRTTILLRFYEDLPPTRVAERLGVPVETVRTRLKRGLALLREKLDARAGGRERWMLALAPLALSHGAPFGVGPALGRGVEVAWRAKFAALLGLGLLTFLVASWVFRDAAGVASAPGARGAATAAAASLAAEGPAAAEPSSAAPRSPGTVVEPVETWMIALVRDTDRAPLARHPVEVRVAGREAKPGLTDELGRLWLRVPIGHGVTLASRGSREVLRGELELAARTGPGVDSAGSPSSPRTFEWELAAASSVVGRVLDAQALPVAGATVTLFHGLQPFVDAGLPIDFAQRAETAADGGFEFHGLPREFSLIAERGDELTVAGLAAQLGRPGEVAGVQLRLAPSWRVRGRVSDAHGRPLAGATISAANHDRRGRGRSAGQAGVSYRSLVRQRTRSDADGWFEFTRLAAVPHDLTAALAPYTDATLELRGPAEDLRLVLDEGLELTVEVVDGDGAAIRDARVRALGPGRDPGLESATDERGCARFSLQRDEPVFLRASAPGFAVRFDAPFSLPGAPSRRVVVLDAARPIRGRVVDEHGRAAAPFVVEARLPIEYLAEARELWVPKLDESLVVARAETNEHGEFVLDGADDREFELAAILPAGSSARAVARARGGCSEVELVLDAPGEDTTSFSGRVFDRSSGRAIESFRVIAQRAGEQGARAVAAGDFSSATGEFRLFGGRPGRWWIWVRAEGFAPGLQALREYGPGEQALECGLDPALDLVIRVVDARGEPVRDARVICSDGEGRPLPAMVSPGYWLNSMPCDGFGAAAFVGLPARPFAAHVRVAELEQLFGFDVDPASARDGEIELALPVDLSSERESLELDFVVSSEEARQAGAAGGLAQARWLGRCRVRVIDAAGAVAASFAGELTERGLRQEKPFTYFVVRVDDASRSSYVYQRVEHRDPAGLRDGPELAADGRVRIAVPRDAVWLEVEPEGAQAFRVPLAARREGALVVGMPAR